MVLGLLGGAAKGIGRDLAMGFGVSERDEDYYNRTRENLRRQYGDARADLYDRQTAAQRAAAPRGRVEKPKRSERGILGTIIGDLTLGLPNRGRSTRSTSRGSGSDMSSSLRPMIRPPFSFGQGEDLGAFESMQKNILLRSNPDIIGPDRGVGFFNEKMQTIPDNMLSTFSQDMYRDYLLNGGTLDFTDYLDSLSGLETVGR